MNILLVVGNSGALVAEDTFTRDRLVNVLGHTVTYIDDGATPNLTGVDLVVIARSATYVNYTTKYDSTTVGVLSVAGQRVPHTSYGASTTPTGGAAQQALYVVAPTSDPITGPATQNADATISVGNTIAYAYLLTSNLGAGVVTSAVATSGTLTRSSVDRYETGAAMFGGVLAPSRRARVSLNDTQTLNATGLQWFDQSVAWTAGGNKAPSANAGGDQSVAPGALVTLSGSGSDPDLGDTLTYAWTKVSGTATPVLTGASTATATFTAPSSVDGDVLVYRLTVTDGGGLTATDDVTVTVAPSSYRTVRTSGAWVRKRFRVRDTGAWV